MNIENAKKLILDKLVINGRLNRHYTRIDWREKNNLSSLFDLFESILPGGNIKTQIEIILKFDGVAPSECIICKETPLNLIHDQNFICNTCQVDISNNKRKKTNLKKYGTASPTSNSEIKRKIKETKLAKYGDENYNNGEKTKQTSLERYGVEHHMQNKEIASKVVNTHIEKYGSIYMNTEKQKTKNRETNLEKYGVEHHMQRNEVKEKIKETNLEKYGYENPYQFSKEKIKETKLAKYGDENYNNREKTKETNLKRYGCEYISQHDDVKQKIITTCNEKYGVDHHFSCNEIQEKRVNSFKANYYLSLFKKFTPDQLEYLENTDEIYNEHIQNKKPIRQIAKENGFTYSFLNRYMIQKGYDIKIYYGYSQEQYDFYEYLQKHFNLENVELNDRTVIKPKEIDILLRDYMIGIEYHGSYWHSTQSEEIDFSHKEKFILAKNAGLHLFQFFDREIENKLDLVTSMISYKMNVGDIRKIYARKCKVKELDNQIYKNFCDENHIQGYAPGKIKIGLFEADDNLIAIMSFSKSRFTKKYEYEMVRFSNKKMVSVIGGMSKLFSFFVKKYNPKSIVTYADARFFSGNGYEKLGFEFSHHSQPNYWYIDSQSDEIQSRMKYQKHKLPDLIEIYDPNMTEKRNMVENGFRIINDAGNLVYQWSSM